MSDRPPQHPMCRSKVTEFPAAYDVAAQMLEQIPGESTIVGPHGERICPCGWLFPRPFGPGAQKGEWPVDHMAKHVDLDETARAMIALGCAADEVASVVLQRLRERRG